MFDVPLSAEFVVLLLSGSIKGVVAFALIIEFKDGSPEIMYLRQPLTRS
jgi:hypothetical protein